MAGVQDYLAQRCPGAASLELATLIQAHTDGTPLFVAAVIDHLIGRGRLVETDPGWALTVPLSEVELGVPDDVREIIRTELRSLRPRARAMLETASVAGVEFDVQAVAAAMRAPTEADRGALRASGARGPLPACRRQQHLARRQRCPVLRLPARPAPAGGLRRRSRRAPAGVPPAARRGARARLRRSGRPRSRAHSPITSSTAATTRAPSPTLPPLRPGAQQRFAPRQVIAYLESALRLLEQPAGWRASAGAQELGLRLQIGPSLNAVHGYASDAVRANYDRALALCDDNTGAAQRYAVLYALWHSRSMRAERAETRRTAEELVEQAVHLGPAERWLAQSLLGRTALYEGAFAEARARLEPLRATWPHTPGSDAPLFGPAPLVASDGHLAEALWYLGFPDQASAVSRDALARGQQSDSPFTRRRRALPFRLPVLPAQRPGRDRPVCRPARCSWRSTRGSRTGTAWRRRCPAGRSRGAATRPGPSSASRRVWRPTAPAARASSTPTCSPSSPRRRADSATWRRAWRQRTRDWN